VPYRELIVDEVSVVPSDPDWLLLMSLPLSDVFAPARPVRAVDEDEPMPVVPGVVEDEP
jgi:hypothetical protein